jgi:hypothetical protein
MNGFDMAYPPSRVESRSDVRCSKFSGHSVGETSSLRKSGVRETVQISWYFYSNIILLFDHFLLIYFTYTCNNLDAFHFLRRRAVRLFSANARDRWTNLGHFHYSRCFRALLTTTYTITLNFLFKIYQIFLSSDFSHGERTFQ